METPEQKAFARSVLWKLACLQADVYENQLLLVELVAAHRGVPAITVQAHWAEESAQLRRDLYRKALRESGLTDEPPPEHNQE